MKINELQEKCAEMYKERGYRADLVTLGLGVAEEAGEVAKAINLLNPMYIPTPNREHHDLGHELLDLLIYMCHVANQAEIDINSLVENKFVKVDK